MANPLSNFPNMAGLGNMLGSTSTCAGSYMDTMSALRQQQQHHQAMHDMMIAAQAAPPTPYAGVSAPVMRQVQPKQEKSMFTEIATDVKKFVIEHRSVIYFLAFALIVDHLFFKDAFRHRLQAMADKIVAKVEAKI